MPTDSYSDPEFQDPESPDPQSGSTGFENPMHDPTRPFERPAEPDRNRSRQPDPVSIGSGLVFFLVGGAYLLASGGQLTVNAGWTLSMLALGLGLSGIVGAVLRSRRGGDRRD